MSKNSLTVKAGLPPGTLVHIGKKHSDSIRIQLIEYSQDHFESRECKQVDECFSALTNNHVSWINIDGLHDVPTIESLGSPFGLHPLLMEDILHTHQRPKTESYDNCLYVTLRMLGISKDKKHIVSEQVSLVLGDNWVLSFQEREGDLFDGLRERLSQGQGITRKKGADYLLYRLIDTLVDNYFFVTDHFSEKSEKLEIEALESPTEETLARIQEIKKQLIELKRVVVPLREAVSSLYRDESKLIKKDVTRYFRDVYEHTVQVIDSIETQRDIISGVTDLYLSGISNKMNEVMKVLTIIATIFIPLTFIAGIYGMNFAHMPELSWEYGYASAWGLMLLVTIIMIIFFKRKKWL